MWRYVAAILIATAAPAKEAEGTASQLLPGCKYAIAKWERSATASGSDFDRAFCIGYVTGLGKSHAFCAPAGVTVGQLMRVIVKYLEARPELHHGDFGDLALIALSETWPCQRR